MSLWAEFDLQKINDLIAGETPTYHLLSPATLILALDGLTRFPSARFAWRNSAGELLTDAEWSAALALVWQAQHELLEAVMIGSIMTFAGTIPGGWLLCDGSVVSREDYAGLFAVIGETYGPGDGSTTFGLPDLQGRVIVGQHAGQTAFEDMGQSGGEAEHTLTVAEMPAHSHDESGSIWLTVNGGLEAPAPVGVPNPLANTGATGGDEAHNNLQPYLVLRFGIKW